MSSSWLYGVAIGVGVAEGVARTWFPTHYARLAVLPHALSRRFVSGEASPDAGSYRALGHRALAVLPRFALPDVALDGGRARLHRVSHRELVLVGVPPSRQSRTGNFLVRIVASVDGEAIVLRGYEHPTALSAPIAALCFGVAAQQAGAPNPWLVPVLLLAIVAVIGAAMRFQAAIGKERALREAFDRIERAMAAP